MMETKYIQEFVILAETCSFQETAERAFVSQSSLTKHIQKMEKELGVSLFDRTTRTVKLNQYGAEFYKYAKQIVQLSWDYETAIRNMVKGREETLTVAFQSRLGQYGIVQMLSLFSKEYPGFKLKLIENNQVVQLLKNGKCDFVFSVEDGPLDDDIEKIIYRRDNLAVVLPSNHPLAGKSRITIEQLRNEKFIVHEDTPQNVSMETLVLRDLCAEKGFEPNEVMTVSYTSNLVRMVAQGMGIAVINRLQLPGGSNNDGDVVFVDIDPAVPFYAKLMYHKRMEKVVAAATFLEFAKEQIAGNYSSLSEPCYYRYIDNVKDGI